jgi:hypothetical protein
MRTSTLQTSRSHREPRPGSNGVILNNAIVNRIGWTRLSQFSSNEFDAAVDSFKSTVFDHAIVFLSGQVLCGTHGLFPGVVAGED